MSLSDVELADGETPCPWCGNRPPFGDPWASVHLGTTIWSRACLDCWLANDDSMRPN